MLKKLFNTMDVISISSDSENLNEEPNKSSCSPNWDDEVYVDWNNDDYPAIDYDSDPMDSGSQNSSKLEEKIEEFVTPLRQSKNIADRDEVLNTSDQTINYVSDSVKGTSSQDLKTGSPCKYLTSDITSISNIDKKCDSGKKTFKQPRQKLSQEEKYEMKLMKEQRKFEREKSREEKKAEQIRQKAIKAALMENHKNLKPEENIKFLKVHIDNEIINSACGSNIIPLLQQSNIQYAVEAQIKSNTIIWTKKTVSKVVNDLGELEDEVEYREENQLVYVLDWKKALELVHSNELLSHVETVKSSYIDKKLTLAIFGLGKYFQYRVNKRKREMKAEINDKKKTKLKSHEKVFEEAPSISKDQLEFALSDLQLIGNHNCRLLETPEDLSFLILNFTKSLSQVDLLMEKRKRQETGLGWLALGDIQSVKIDKNGNGLLKLWQQQICQFSCVGLDTAQAIVSHFNSPLALMTQYENCESGKEGELLLQNIQIRREAGILSSNRRVGPQLSKKMYNFFTTDDPDLEL